MIPRSYQRLAIRKVLDYAAACPTGRLLLVIPTRGGKTLVGAILALQMALRHGLRALWMAHREELLDEAVAHLVDVGIHPASIGVIKTGRSSDPAAKIQVASEQTIVRRRVLPPAHLVITDESHRDTAVGRRRIRAAYPKAFLLGLSATPKPPLQRDLGEDYDALMVVVQPSELIHDGYLSVPTIFAPKESAVPDLRGLRLYGGDFSADDLETLLLRQNLLDEQVAEWARLNDGRTSLAFAVTVKHSEALVARFQAAGIAARHVDGTTKNRADVLAGLTNGTIPIVSSVGVFAEGTNIHRVKCILGLRPTYSLPLYIQQMMRCATPWEHETAFVLDVVGNIYRHGYPHADRHWSLNNEESGLPLPGHGGILKRCPGCGAMMPAGLITCSNCKVPFPAPTPQVPDVPLELQEVTLADAKLEAERRRLLDYATSRGFTDPTAWTDRVLAKLSSKRALEDEEGAAA